MPWMFSFLNTDNKACTVNLNKDDIKMENAEIQGKLDNFTDIQLFYTSRILILNVKET